MRQSTSIRYAISIPFLLLVVLGLLIPLGYNLYFSLLSYDSLSGTYTWDGGGSYVRIMGDFKDIMPILKNTLSYTVITVFFQTFLGLILALWVFSFGTRKYKVLISTLLLLPYFVTPTISVFIWEIILDVKGPLNELLGGYLLQSKINFFSPDRLRDPLVIVNTWQYYPFVYLLCFLRLETLEENLKHSTIIDGANYIGKLTHVYLPYLKYTIFIVVALRFIWIFMKFDLAYLLIGKSSLASIYEVFPVYLFEEIFSARNYPGASALSIVLFILLSILLVFIFKNNKLS